MGLAPVLSSNICWIISLRCFLEKVEEDALEDLSLSKYVILNGFGRSGFSFSTSLGRRALDFLEFPMDLRIAVMVSFCLGLIFLASFLLFFSNLYLSYYSAASGKLTLKHSVWMKGSQNLLLISMYILRLK